MSSARSHTIPLVIAIGVLGPATIAYHGFAHWVFRGRQRPEQDAPPLGNPAGPSRLPGTRPAEGGR